MDKMLLLRMPPWQGICIAQNIFCISQVNFQARGNGVLKDNLEPEI